MSASGFTPIQLYRTSTAAATPSAGNLADGELAINLTDEKLYFKNASGVVKLLASNSGSLGSVTSVNASGSTTGLTFTGGPITSSGTLTLGGTLGVANGGTGTSTQFTAGSVVFAGASGVYTQDNAQLFWDNANDRLGIGTATPGYRLDVNGGGGVRLTNASPLIWNNSSGVARPVLQIFSDNNLYLDAEDGAQIFRTLGSERMRITSAGNVGIGTNNPTSFLGKLAVVGNITAATGGKLYQFDSGNSTGRYMQAVSNYGLAIGKYDGGDVEQVRITDVGNVGIGTTIPAAKLDVDLSNGAAGIRVSVGSGAYSGYVAQFGVTGQSNGYYISKDASNNIQHIWDGTGGAERMRITSAGDVGIGTSNPAVKLAVEGTGNTQVNIAKAGTTGYLALGANSATVSQISAFRSDSPFVADLALNPDGGNVGIGTLSPGAKLHVDTGASSGTALIVGATSASASQINMGIGVVTAGRPFIGTNTNTNPLEIGTRNASDLIFLTNTTERMRITSAGRVGIGATSPEAVLTVYNPTTFDVRTSGVNVHRPSSYGQYGSFAYDGDITYFGSTYTGGGAGSYGQFVFNAYDSTATPVERMRITNTGSIGIGTASPLSTLDVRGTFRTVTTSGVASTTLISAIGGVSNGFEISKDTSDNLTYYWRRGNNNVAMILDSSGNVGIGTSSPGTPLDVVGTTRSGNFRVNSGGSVAGGGMWGNDTNLAFNTDSTERMRIDTSGNVGIGTSSPGAKLHVNGNIVVGGAASDNYIYSTSSGLLGIQVNTGPLLFLRNNGANESMRIDSSGNVLVGTTTALGTTSGRGNITVNGTSSILSFGISGSLGGYVLHDGTDLWVNNTLAGAQRFYTNGSERMRIDSSGNLLVGRTSGGGGRLEVDGNYIRYGNSASYTNDEFLIQRIAAGVSLNARQNVAMVFSTNDTERARIDSSGNLLVGQSSLSISTVGASMEAAGTISSTRSGSTNATSTLNVYSTGAAAYRFYVDMAGTINATSTSISAISDIRLKENVRDLDAGLDTILALKPRRFDWKEGKGKDIRDDMGFIAQEVEEVLPELIGGWKAGEGEPDDLKSVKAGDLIPVLVKAIQELTARVAQLEGN